MRGLYRTTILPSILLHVVLEVCFRAKGEVCGIQANREKQFKRDHFAEFTPIDYNFLTPWS